MIDLTGQRYGRLTVMYPTGESRYHSRCWLCRCDCGQNKIATNAELRSGNVKSCGCLKKHHDLTGKRYGKLTVLERAGKNSWFCRCDCENELTVTHHDLVYSRVKSCGHKRNLIGKRYGRLTVVRKVKGDDVQLCGDDLLLCRCDLWLCRCDCGHALTLSYADLINKRVLSCGDPGHLLPNEPDYTGVTINGFIGVSKVRNSYWRWRCSRCGNVTERKAADVKIGKPCPCQIDKDEVDYTGVKYNNLTGVRKVGKDRWLWQCDCGALSVYNVDDVISGKKQSCHGKRGHRERKRLDLKRL